MDLPHFDIRILSVVRQSRISLIISDGDPRNFKLLGFQLQSNGIHLAALTDGLSDVGDEAAAELN